MSKLSQNKKIAISAVSLFIVSFSTMLFFLSGGNLNPEDLKAGISEGESHQEDGEKKVLESSKRDMGFVTDVEGVIQKANPGFCKLVGEDCEKLAGQKFFDLVDKDDLGELASIYVKLGQEGKKMDAIGPFRLIDGDKNKLVLFSAFPVKDEAGKVVKIRFSAKDITEKVEDLNKSDEKIEKSRENEEKSWIEKIYPKIKDLNEQGNKLLVKISYKNEE